MDDQEIRRLDMLRRVQDFGEAHADAFPQSSLGGELFATVGAVVTELEGHAAAQSSGTGAARQGSTTKAIARAALREDLQAISRTARSMAATNPGLEDMFRVPRSNGDQALLNAARAFARDAAPLSAEFIRHEMPADFLEDLNADIDDFEAAMNDQNRGAEARVAATAAIDAAIERGVETVRRLDALVRNKFRSDPATLAAWLSASHTQRAPRKASTPPQPSAPTT